MPEQPYFSAEAHCNGTIDQDTGKVPQWCDLTVTIEHGDQADSNWAVRNEDGSVTLFMTRAAGQVVIDVIYETLHPYSGRSIQEVMRRQLDEVVERLMTGKAEDGDKFLARGMAMAMACLRNPLNPDWEAIRDDAVDRYNANN